MLDNIPFTFYLNGGVPLNKIVCNTQLRTAEIWNVHQWEAIAKYNQKTEENQSAIPMHPVVCQKVLFQPLSCKQNIKVNLCANLNTIIIGERRILTARKPCSQEQIIKRSLPNTTETQVLVAQYVSN
jgi:hypothetical protein